MTRRSEASAAVEASAKGEHLPNLASDLDSSDPDVRHQAIERIPEFISKGLKVASAVLGNHEDAEEVVSEALRKWLSNPGRYNPTADISELVWFQSVVRNMAIDRLRRRYREHIGHSRDPSGAEEVEHLYAAISALSASDQRVLRMYLEWDAAPPPWQIATRLGSALGVTDRKAKAMFAAARLALRREMRIRLETPFRRGESRADDLSVGMLTAEFDAMFERMQQPGEEEVMLRAFRSSPEELGRAAVADARKEVG